MNHNNRIPWNRACNQLLTGIIMKFTPCNSDSFYVNVGGKVYLDGRHPTGNAKNAIFPCTVLE